MRQARVAAVAAWLLTVGTAHAGVGGTYDTPLGPMALKKTGGNVTGVSAAGGGPCGFKKGQSLLKGQLEDDTVSGKLTICSEGPGCGVQEAFVVLLVARDGALLSGAVQMKNKACKLPLAGKGIALSRTATQGQPARAVPKAARVKKSDAPVATPPVKGQPTPPTAAVEADPPPTTTPVAASEVTAKFGAWNPDSSSRAGPGGRDVARQRAREANKKMKEGQWEPARAEFLAAIQADPGYPVPYLGMGVTYFARDNYDDALDWYKKALTVDPDFGDAYYNIACIYSLEKKKPLALRYLRIAVLNGYKRPKDLMADGDLDNIRAEPEFKEIMASLLGPDAPAPVEAPAAPVAAPDAGSAALPSEPPPPEAPVEPPSAP